MRLKGTGSGLAVDDGKTRLVIILKFSGTMVRLKLAYVEFIIMWRVTIRSRFLFVQNLNLPTKGISKVAHIIVPQRYCDGLLQPKQRFLSQPTLYSKCEPDNRDWVFLIHKVRETEYPLIDFCGVMTEDHQSSSLSPPLLVPSLQDLVVQNLRGEYFTTDGLLDIIIKAQPHHSRRSLSHLSRYQLIDHLNALLAWWKQANPRKASLIVQDDVMSHRSGSVRSRSSRSSTNRDDCCCVII